MIERSFKQKKKERESREPKLPVSHSCGLLAAVLVGLGSEIAAGADSSTDETDAGPLGGGLGTLHPLAFRFGRLGGLVSGGLVGLAHDDSPFRNESLLLG